MAPLVVGFDLDMTLIDSRVGVHATLRALIGGTGAPIDADVEVARLGPPLEQELATWVPAEQIDPLADRFRELYVDLRLVGLVALPGAATALAGVRAARRGARRVGSVPRRHREVRAERLAVSAARRARRRPRRRLASGSAEG